MATVASGGVPSLSRATLPNGAGTAASVGVAAPITGWLPAPTTAAALVAWIKNPDSSNKVWLQLQVSNTGTAVDGVRGDVQMAAPLGEVSIPMTTPIPPFVRLVAYSDDGAGGHPVVSNVQYGVLVYS